jgi:hypothetical protein
MLKFNTIWATINQKPDKKIIRSNFNASASIAKKILNKIYRNIKNNLKLENE